MSDIGAAAGIRGNEGQVLGYKNNVLQAVDVGPLTPEFNAIYHDVLASRVVGNVYQNTTGKPMTVIITSDCLVTANTVDSVTLEIDTDSITPPTGPTGVTPGYFYLQQPAGVPSGDIEVDPTIYAFIPPKWYYAVGNTLTGGAVSNIFTWLEFY